jgi:hypothetical protein
MTAVLRVPTHRYQDPLSLIWIDCAARVGYRVARTTEAYASTDGRRNLLIGEDATLDADDSLAQMILHELCHALVEGEEGERQQDWGLDNIGARHIWREHACLRLQAYLAGRFGLREFLAPTTDFRVRFWNALPADPFAAPEAAGGRRERSCVAARKAAWRAAQPRWATHLDAALTATAAIAAAVQAAGGAASGADGELPPLWDTAAAPPAGHPAGHAPVAPYHAGHGCADCAWCHPSRGALRCRHAPSARLPADAPACMRWEPAATLDCRACAACCREAYDSVEIGAREPVLKRHPQLVIVRETHRKLLRDGGRCAALAGGEDVHVPYACAIYEDRPRACRDFLPGGANCLEARRRAGLSL